MALPTLKAFASEDGANLLGAVGASGGTGDEDEEIYAAGVQAAGLVAG